MTVQIVQAAMCGRKARVVTTAADDGVPTVSAAPTNPTTTMPPAELTRLLSSGRAPRLPRDFSLCCCPRDRPCFDGSVIDDEGNEAPALPGFVRPPIEAVTYHDANGAVIPYGNQWPDHLPAQDSYSVTAHPERFQPTHTVAAALIDYLVATYDVVVLEDTTAVGDFVFPGEAPLRVVRLQPSNPDSAALTFAFSNYPDVSAHAGVTADVLFLNCGCDACDETWESVADEMEAKVGSVVNGGFTETVGTGDDPMHKLDFDGEDGNSASTSWSSADAAVLQRVREQGLALPWNKTWLPWPRR